MLEKVTDRIYYMMHDDENDRPALGVVVGDNCCLIVDSGNSPKHAEDLKKELNSMNLPEVKYLVITHHHWDHTFGLGEWDVTTIANQRTYEYMKTYCGLSYDDQALEEAKGKQIFKDFSIKCIKKEIENLEAFQPQNCNLSFEGELRIDLGGIICYIRQIPSPHTDDSTIVYVPDEQAIFLGDCLYGYNSKGYNYYNRELVRQMIDTLEQYTAKYYLCSHESICTREEISDFWQQLHMGADITKYSDSLEAAIAEYQRVYGSEPKEDELFFIKSFGVGDGWGRTGELKPEIF